jgi:predicted pyridoxine 5'-phosphate oxidase superfamily flavin-nucleotide-binding protein
MAKLTQEMKDLVAAQQCFVATVGADGEPNVAPKRSTMVLDDEHLAFAEVTGKQTWANVQRGSKVAIAVVDRDKMTGYRFVGAPELVTAGPLFDRAGEAMKARGIMAPLKAVVRVGIEAIYGLGGPRGGDRIE